MNFSPERLTGRDCDGKKCHQDMKSEERKTYTINPNISYNSVTSFTGSNLRAKPLKIFSMLWNR